MKNPFFRRPALLLCLVMTAAVLCGCRREPQPYSAVWFDVFDTVTTIRGTSESAEAFRQQADVLHEELLRLHRLFDVYHEYEGTPNLKTVNDSAGIVPVAVEPEILELLTDCRRFYELTGGTVNVCMGSVLALWHDARIAAAADPEHAALPDPALLQEAAQHTDFENLILDNAAGTVFLADPRLRLDVGAVAKGWAARRASALLPQGWLLSIGGNVLASGPKQSDGTPWSVGIQDPDSEGYAAVASLTEGSMVTSGDYRRFFTVDGKAYHHIIDPATHFPGGLWRSVTVFCPDSALADALSTALFLMDRQQGQTLLDHCGAEALWIAPDCVIHCSDGFPVS